MGAPKKGNKKLEPVRVSVEQEKIDLLGIERIRIICTKSIDANYQAELIKQNQNSIDPKQTYIK